MKGIPRESCLQARQQLGQELRGQLVAKTRDEPQTPSQPHLSSNTLSSFQASVSSVGAIHWQCWASLYLSCPLVVQTLLFKRLSPARRWRLPCLMTLLLLYPALSRHSMRRGETLNFCNGLKWSKYHSPPCICYSFKPRYRLLPNFLVHWQRQRAFPWRGNPCGFRASLNLALCSFHSNYPESFHTFCHRNSREGPFS